MAKDKEYRKAGKYQCNCHQCNEKRKYIRKLIQASKGVKVIILDAERNGKDDKG